MKIFFLVSFLCILCNIGYSQKILSNDNGIEIIYKFNKKKNTANIIGVQNLNKQKTLYIQDSVVFNGFTFKVISITKDAFKNISSIDTLIIPSGNILLEQEAFGGTSLVYADLSGVEYLPYAAFYSCNKLEKVILSDKIKEIGDKTFDKCSSLKFVKVNTNCKVSDKAFYYKLKTKRDNEGISIDCTSAPIVYSKFILTPDGFKSTENNDCDYIVINKDGYDGSTIINSLYMAIINNCAKCNVKKENLVLYIENYIPGYTKTDGRAGSAYNFDLYFRIVIEVKDNKFRILAPSFELSNEACYRNSEFTKITGIVKPSFRLSMNLKGRNDKWSDKHKIFNIYNNDNELLESSTKEKLENTINYYIELLHSLQISKYKDNW